VAEFPTAPAESTGAPLAGRSILVLRPAGQGADLAGALEALGATAVVVPAVAILPPDDWSSVDDALARLGTFDWVVFTSANGARLAGERLASGTAPFVPPSCRVAAIGPATADTLEDLGIRVDWMPSRYTTESLAGELPDPPGRVCLLRADIAGPELDDGLRTRGFELERVDAYRTEAADPAAIRDALRRGIDAVALTSASIARSLVAAAGGVPLPGAPLVCCIGPATAKQCRAMGLPVDCEAAEYTVGGLVAAIEARLGRGV
jgi:uroporphyrinogen-III synthase